MKIIVGLTGTTGSGKSTVSAVFSDCGFEIIDCDKMARIAVEKGSPLLPKLSSAFGNDVIKDDGTLDRKRLASKAFADEAHTCTLNSIMLPYICEMINERIEQSSERYILLDAPTLFESGADSICTSTVGVIAPPQTRLERIMRRDSITEEEARRRMSIQHDDMFFKENCTYVINNAEDVAELKKAARRLAEQLKKG